MMKNELLPNSIPISNPAHVLFNNEIGWTDLVNLDLASGITINPTGLMVWKSIDGKRTVTDIIAEVKKHFLDTPCSFEKDLLAILDTFWDEGLIGFEVKT
jgi:hypothetical protein